MKLEAIVARIVVMSEHDPRQPHDRIEGDMLCGSRGEFMSLATTFQGGLALLALGLARLTGINLIEQLHFTVTAVAWGIGATVPMLALFAVTYRFPVGPLGTIKRFLHEALGPPLAQCRWYDLVFVALLAGCSEELLFRGVLQSWIGRWGALEGLVASSIIFGLAHAITPTYAVLAGLLGIYLGIVFTITGEANLVPATLCHVLYDLVAFFVVRREARQL
jgi:CAAX protease family protein